MASSDQILKILVQAVADTGGLDQTKAKLDDLKQAATGAGQAATGFGTAIATGVGAAAIGVLSSAYRILIDLTEQEKKINEEFARGENILSEHERHWLTMAQNAQTFVDAARLGEQTVNEVTAAHQRLLDAQNKLREGVGFWATFGEFLAKMGGAGAGAQPFTDQLRQQVELFRRLDEQARLASVALQLFAQEEATAFAAMHNLPPVEAIAKTLEKIRSLSEERAGIDPRKGDAELQHWTDLNSRIAVATAQLGKFLTNQQNATDAVKQTRDQIALNNATGNEELSIQMRVQQTYDQKLKSLLAAHVPEAEARDLATQTAESERQRLETIRGQAGPQREYNQALHDSTLLLQSIRQQQTLVEGAPFMGVDAKQTVLLALYRQEMAALGLEIEKQKAEIKGGALDPAQLDAAKLRLQQLVFTQEELNQKIAAGAQPLRAQLAGWVNNFGPAMTQVGNTIESTINASLQGTNQLLLDAAFHTGNWKQTLQGVERQVLNTFLTMLEQMALQQAASLLGITTTTTAQQASGAAIAAAHAPAAAATSISSWGVAALVGEAAAIAAIFAIMAALAHEGGTIGEGRLRRRRMHSGGLAADEVPIIAQEGEIMIQRDVAQSPGMSDFLLGLNAGAFHGGGRIQRLHYGGEPEYDRRGNIIGVWDDFGHLIGGATPSWYTPSAGEPITGPGGWEPSGGGGWTDPTIEPPSLPDIPDYGPPSTIASGGDDPRQNIMNMNVWGGLGTSPMGGVGAFGSTQIPTFWTNYPGVGFVPMAVPAAGWNPDPSIVKSYISRHTPAKSTVHGGGLISRMHSGGAVGGGGGGVHIYAFTDLKALTRHMAGKDGQKIIFDTVKGRRIDLGIS